jgi:hypothetical protein
LNAVEDVMVAVLLYPIGIWDLLKFDALAMNV